MWIKRIWKAIKDDIENSKWSGIDGAMKFEQIYLDRNEDTVLGILKKNNWKILSTDRRICFYGYRVIKYDIVEWFSFDEVLRLGNKDPKKLRADLREELHGTKTK